MIVVSETKDMCFWLSIEIFIDVNGVWHVVVDEAVSLPIDNFVVFVSFFLSQHDILKGSQRLSNLLGVIAFFVLFSSILSLISVGIVLPSLLDFILDIPFLILH